MRFVGALSAMTLVTSPAVATDIEVEVDQETLNSAAGLVTPSGTAIHYVWLTSGCLTAQTLPGLESRKTRLTLFARPFKLSEKFLKPFLLSKPVVSRCKIPVGFMSWAWHVLPSSVEVTSSGLTLNGSLAVEYAQGSSTQAFSFPLAVSYNAQQKALQFSLQQGNVDVEVLMGGQMRHLGTLDLAPHFAASVPLIGAIPLPDGGEVDVNLTNVQISTQSGKLLVTADVTYD